MCHCLRSTWSARAEGQASQWWAAARAPLAYHDVLVRVLQSPSTLEPWSRVPHHLRCTYIQTVIAGLLSVTVVCTCAVHQFAAMMSVSTFCVVCLPLRVYINCYGTTLCISTLCRHAKHACAPMGRRGMGCQQVLCNHCSTVNAYFS